MLITVDAVLSMYKAFYVDKRRLKCACAGGDNAVPPRFISLTEDLMMAAMAIGMTFK